MRKKCDFLGCKLRIAPILLAILLTFCSSSTGLDISDYEIYYFNGDNLDVAEDSSGLLVIIFKKASGENEEIKTVTPGENTTIYDEAGYSLELWEDGGLNYIYPITGGSRAYAVGREGVVVEHEKYVSENTYTVHFIDTTTGNIDYTADIIESSEDGLLAIFREPVNDTISTSLIIHGLSLVYTFTFINEAGSGAIEFHADAEGYITEVNYIGEEIL